MKEQLSFPMFALILLSGCSPIIQYVTVPLDRPERPALPRISDAELQCLDRQTYQKLYDRYRLVKEYAVTLEAIIDSTQPAHLGKSESKTSETEKPID